MLLFPLTALVLAAPPVPGAPKALNAMCEEAVAKFREGSLGAGFALLDAAQKAYPGASQPHALRAQVYQAIARKAAPPAAAYFRVRTEDELEAVYLNPSLSRDGRAQVQVELEAVHAHAFPSVTSRDPKALAAFEEGERSFGARDFQKAREAYGRALAQDPGFVLAMLYLGDTYHSERHPTEALTWYRKAAQAQPAFPKAWRFLADGCAAAGRAQEAEEALLSGLEGNPGNRLLWLKLADLLDAQGRAPKKLVFDPPFRPSWGPEGQLTLQATVPDPGAEGLAIWAPLLTGLHGGAQVKVEHPGPGAPPLETPFQLARFFWTLALGALEAQVQKTGTPVQDRYLAAFLRFKQEGRLDAALFVLRFQEAFRPDFEAWKRAHPGEVQTFIRTYGLRP
ncbi:tetratricopeptide repeat protein [Mesoterricola sediminis]|uniref:Tetratricopeptide repeat protein n=1 Tax=Mesoterricola sediminis TaxID=2927980 RepID=A0AA48H2Q1_9BACT|nr:tetratricopeptide repeat protein [Mesoterricola sediminis]BDU78527.1 hypothetical protein METESE_34850 [Mesoterricola sediminis]